MNDSEIVKIFKKREKYYKILCNVILSWPLIVLSLILIPTIIVKIFKFEKKTVSITSSLLLYTILFGSIICFLGILFFHDILKCPNCGKRVITNKGNFDLNMTINSFVKLLKSKNAPKKCPYCKVKLEDD